MFSSGEDTGEYEEHGGAFVEEFEAPVVNGHLINSCSEKSDSCKYQIFDLVYLQEVAGNFSHSSYQVCHCCASDFFQIFGFCLLLELNNSLFNSLFSMFSCIFHFHS